MLCCIQFIHNSWNWNSTKKKLISSNFLKLRIMKLMNYFRRTGPEILDNTETNFSGLYLKRYGSRVHLSQAETGLSQGGWHTSSNWCIDSGRECGRQCCLQHLPPALLDFRSNSWDHWQHNRNREWHVTVYVNTLGSARHVPGTHLCHLAVWCGSRLILSLHFNHSSFKQSTNL